MTTDYTAKARELYEDWVEDCLDVPTIGESERMIASIAMYVREAVEAALDCTSSTHACKAPSYCAYHAKKLAVEAEREAIAVTLDDRADEWRRTAADLAGKGAPPELRNRAHDTKDEALRWARRVRARGEVAR